ncbi:leucine-rich repeat serine/threonine-protein kinase 1-like isoform X2 [Procambarus clarkii]|uniref:leucine-rich repeat serine/threonine-protein kinase 1-like isoform X2 n=1 Tax=Procambarus clarkii TaxID=6728 RepID=UPI0037421C3E
MTSPSPDDTEEFPGRLLHQAALWDNAELLEDLLNGDQLAHLDCRDAWGRTPLHAAATTESSRCLRILLQAGADANMASGPRAEGRTCLHIASEHGAVENIRLLLDHGADLLAKDANGLTALDLAEQGEHTQCMTVLKNAADARELARQELHSALRESCSRGDVSRAKAILRDLGAEAQIIINSAPNGSNTLLFKACEEGQREMVRLLLDHGADGRIHPVTKYSPLYIACYYGRRDIAEMLLKKFPALVSVSTVERWLPLHACIINGHTAVLELLLKFPYPDDSLRKYWDKTGQYEYEMAFDINMKDVTGQSALYLACYVGNQKLVDLLLKHKVQGVKLKTKEEQERERHEKEQDDSSNDSKSSSRENTKTNINLNVDLVEKTDEVASPTKHRISGGIQALMSKLNLVRTDSNQKDNMISPLDIDMYCNSNTETALHIAVKNKHHSIVSMLLTAGANPNLRVYLPDDEMARLAEDEYIFTGSTALVEACRNRDLGMLDLLLKSHARDDECKALFIAAHAKDEIIVSKLLALKVYKLLLLKQSLQGPR